MCPFPCLFSLLAVAGLAMTCGGTSNVVATARDLYVTTSLRPQMGVPFCVTADVTYVSNRRLVGIEDATGMARLAVPDTAIVDRIRPGDRIAAEGTTARDITFVLARCRTLQILSHGPVPAPQSIRIRDIYSGRFDQALVRTTGLVSDVFLDEIDTRFTYIVLNDGDTSVCATVGNEPGYAIPVPTDLIGHTVTVTGICSNIKSTDADVHRRLGYVLVLDALPSLPAGRTGGSDRFAVPDISDVSKTSLGTETSPLLRKAAGHVIAVWQGNQILLQTDAARPARVSLAEGVAPKYGDFIEAVGFAETDLFLVNLSRAVWRKPADGKSFVPQPAAPVSAARLFSDGKGHPQINPGFYGKAIGLVGLVKHRSAGTDDGRLYVESDGFLLTVDASACPEALASVTAGCTVRVAGTCVTLADAWHPNAAFPRVRDNILVVRTPDDVVLLSRPPWWTPVCLLGAIGVLFLIIVAVTIWNALLRKTAERRGRELADETVAHVESELKVRERSRLAVELHDSISQNLTCAAMEIRTVNRPDNDLPTNLAERLDIALKTINSSREEIRNCIWDLRNSVLEENDVGTAIRMTLAQHLGDAALAVRFNVARELLSDNTMHAILNIVRELTANAIRHGGARNVRVAGAIENGQLLFSVRDDGCGFDPETCPGMEQGHFGLEGIRERARNIKGKVTVESAPGKGTKVSVAIDLPQRNLS